MSANSPAGDVDEDTPSIQEMVAMLEELDDRVEDLEAENESLRSQLEAERQRRKQLEAASKAANIGTRQAITDLLETSAEQSFLTAVNTQVAELKRLTYGDLWDDPDEREELFGDVALAEQALDGSANNAVSNGVARDQMLPIHRMWMDVRLGNDDELKKSHRRAALLFGGFIRRAAGKSPSEDSTLVFNGVDASGQTYSLSSTDAKTMLEECDYIDGKIYSATIKRAFERVQQFSKDESCDCSNIEVCPHGLVTIDVGGTNHLVANKARFNDAMQRVVSAVKDGDGQSGPISDDSVSPANGQDEDLAVDSTDETAEQPAETATTGHGGEDVREQLEQLSQAPTEADDD